MCKFLRHGNEGGKALETWLALYKAGVNPMLAAYVSTFISAKAGAKFTAQTVYAHCQIFESAASAPDINLLLEGKPQPTALNTSRVFGGTNQGGSSNSDFSSKIRSFCSPVAKTDGWGGTIRAKAVDESELIEQVLKWQQELQGIQAKPRAKKPTKTTVFLEEDM